MESKRLTSTAVTLTTVGFVGPTMLAIGILALGGEFLDGFLGSQPTNTPTQAFFIDVGGYVTLTVAAIGFVFGLIFAVRHLKRDWRAILMPLCPLIGLSCCFIALVISNFV